MTDAGALPSIFCRLILQRANTALLGSAAGVTLTAPFFSLIIPGLEAAGLLSLSNMGSPPVTVVGVLVGAAFITALNEIIPHEQFYQGCGGRL